MEETMEVEGAAMEVMGEETMEVMEAAAIKDVEEVVAATIMKTELSPEDVGAVGVDALVKEEEEGREGNGEAMQIRLMARDIHAVEVGGEGVEEMGLLQD